jgi:predicted metal-dependent peptidase
MQPDYEKALEKCKIQLMMKPDTVFYTTILFSLVYIWAEDDAHIWGGQKPTACVDGVRMWNNPKFFMDLDEDERIFLILHEIMHIALMHMVRQGNRHGKIWNYAGDYVINLILVDAGYKMPKMGLLDQRFRDMDTEQIYDILYMEYSKKWDQLGGKLDDHIPAVPGIRNDIRVPSDEDLQGVAADIADILVQAQTQAEAAGDDPGMFPGAGLVAVKGIIDPKLPWELILQNYLDEYNKDDYTMHRPNRRFRPDFYLPTCRSEAICNLTIAVDASVSVADHEFSYFIDEIIMIQERMLPDEITLITFDTKVRQVDEITHNTDILKEIEFKARGGTQLDDLMKYLDEHKPTVALIFSDGEFSIPKKPDETDVIWIIHDDPKWECPYGEVVHYDMDGKT